MMTWLPYACLGFLIICGISAYLFVRAGAREDIRDDWWRDQP